jgi:hypothetical protein
VVMAVDVNFCPDCGAERYNSSNFCLKCGFNFKEIASDQFTWDEFNNSDNSGQEQSNLIDESVQSGTTEENHNLMDSQLGEVSFSHVPYADLNDIKSTLDLRYNCKPVHIERDPDDGNIYIIKTSDHKSITLKLGTFGAKEMKPGDDLVFNSVPSEDLRDIRSFLKETFDSSPIHIDRNVNDGNLYEIKTDQGTYIKLKLGAGKIKIIREDKKSQEVGESQEVASTPVKDNNGIMVTGFIFGLVSIFLNEIGMIPLTGIIISIIGLVTYKEEKHKGLWMGIVALVLNILYSLVNANMNGHL